MDREMFDYEHKLLDEVSHSRFSFKKIIRLLKLDAIAGQCR